MLLYNYRMAKIRKLANTKGAWRRVTMGLSQATGVSMGLYCPS